MLNQHSKISNLPSWPTFKSDLASASLHAESTFSSLSASSTTYRFSVSGWHVRMRERRESARHTLIWYIHISYVKYFKGDMKLWMVKLYYFVTPCIVYDLTSVLGLHNSTCPSLICLRYPKSVWFQKVSSWSSIVRALSKKI